MRFLVVANETEACPYLPGRAMCLPLRMPLSRLGPEQFDQQLAEGDRRTGPLLYRPQCPTCDACEAIRVPVDRFRPPARSAACGARTTMRSRSAASAPP